MKCKVIGLVSQGKKNMGGTFVPPRLGPVISKFLFPDTTISRQDLTQISWGNNAISDVYNENWLDTTPLLFDSSFPELLEALTRALDPNYGVLSEIMIRRIERHFFDMISIVEIAKEEGRSQIAVRTSINSAMRKLHMFLFREEFIRPNTSKFEFEGLFGVP